MSKVTDKLLNFMKLNDEDEYEEEFFDGEEEEEEESDVTEEESATEEEPKMRNFFARRAEEKQVQEEEEEEKAVPVRETVRRTNITSYKTNRDVPSVDRGGEMVKVVRAQEFEEVRAMIDLLKENKIVVVNLEGLNVDVAQRIIDCISGASYALDGKLEGVNDNIFILAPKDVEITGDLKNRLANGSISPKFDRY